MLILIAIVRREAKLIIDQIIQNYFPTMIVRKYGEVVPIKPHEIR